jgi:hypothetical protein
MHGQWIDTPSPLFYVHSMSAVIAAPVDWIESVGNLRFPAKADHRLRELMDRNNEGLLAEHEREELEALAELSEQLSLLRAEALQLLGKQPE